MDTKYVFVTGGVVSGLGKGITAASLGRLLKARGYRVTIQKFDPYINIDPGTMSPYQHGEVFVTEDGAETDLDIGHYERFIDENLTINCNTTSGKIYWSVLNKERKGDFLGATVQVIPHITNAIKEHLFRTARFEQAEIVITEVGGTVGDIESLPFIEAIRQAVNDVGHENAAYVHVTLIPYLSKSGEMKTKPTQHSVKELLSIGVQPDIIVCRTEQPISDDMREKLSLFCNVRKDCIIENLDCESIYDVPLLLEEERFAQIICRRLGLDPREPDLAAWRAMVKLRKDIAASRASSVTIGLVGKYTELHDAYLSVAEALKHAGIHNGSDVRIRWISSEHVTPADLEDVHGVLVPGGFGDRGVEGMIDAIGFAKARKIPFLGICLGMQCAVIGFAREALGLADAHSAELSDTENPVIDLMPEQKEVDEKGGTMRLGAYPCKLLEGSLAQSLYGRELVYERHRHRYEFNNAYRKQMQDAGLIISGVSPDERLVEIVELPREIHPWFVGVQFHPEFKSRPNKPHPVFDGFVKSALALRQTL